MSLKRISIILVIIMVGFWLAFHTITTNAGVKKRRDKGFVLRLDSKLIKTIDLKTRRIEYADETSKYLKVFNSTAKRRFLNALPVKAI